MDDDLYADPEICQEILMDYYRHPRCAGEVEPGASTVRAEVNNPACGDVVRVSLNWENGRITAARTNGAGCAVSQGSASLLMERLEGLSREEAAGVLQDVKRLLSGELPVGGSLERLNALRVVTRNRARVRCAGLACEAALSLLPAARQPDDA